MIITPATASPGSDAKGSRMEPPSAFTVLHETVVSGACPAPPGPHDSSCGIGAERGVPLMGRKLYSSPQELA